MNAPNVKLKAVFEALGFSNVQSVISSGNILFESDETDTVAIESETEKALLDRMNIVSSTMVRSIEQIKKMVALNPFGDRIHSPKTYLTVTFLKNKPLQRPKATKNMGHSSEVIAYLPDTKTLYAINNTTETKTPDFMTKLEREFGKEITTRTWNTVMKIHQSQKIDPYG